MHNPPRPDRQASLTLQAVEHTASALILPHLERESAEMRRLRPNPETEATAVRSSEDGGQEGGRS